MLHNIPYNEGSENNGAEIRELTSRGVEQRELELMLVSMRKLIIHVAWLGTRLLAIRPIG
jgi:hypothetical protein